jgi:hypothetical protein
VHLFCRAWQELGFGPVRPSLSDFYYYSETYSEKYIQPTLRVQRLGQNDKQENLFLRRQVVEEVLSGPSFLAGAPDFLQQLLFALDKVLVLIGSMQRALFNALKAINVELALKG